MNTKIKNYLRILIAGLSLSCSGAPGFANFLMSPSGTTTAFAIDAANQGTALCAAASTECPAAVPVNTAGAPFFTSGTPGLVTLTGTNNIATVTTVTAVTGITNALPAGTNVIGHVIGDTGSTTAVTGNVTVVQPTGTNLHAVLDTTSTTAVTQATGTNLHAVIDTGSTTAVTQATGTNLHAVIDTGSTTAVTQATGTNLHAVLDSGTLTTVSTVTNLAQMNGAALLMGNGTTGTGSQRVTIASDNTAFGVNATLQASATTAIGKVDPNTITNWGLAAATQNVAAPTNGMVVMGQFTTSPTTLTTTNVSPLQMDNAGNLLVNIKAGAAAGGTSSNFAAAFPSAGTAIGAKNGTNMVNLTADGSGSLNVNIASGGGTGGTAIADGGTFTEASTSFTPIGGEFVTGGGAANCTTGKGCTVQMTIDRMAYVNIGKINGIVPLMGNGVTGTGSQRVTIASDNTAFSVNSTLSAETTKVIGTTRTVGNVGGVMDAIGQNVTAPANWLQAGCQFTTSPTTITTGNGSPLSCDNANNLNVNVKTATGIGMSGVAFGSQTGSAILALSSTNAPTATAGSIWPVSISPASGGVRIDLKDTAANTNPFLVTGSGTAGSAAAGVVTIQGIASMTKLLVTPDANSAVNVAQYGGTNIVNGGLAGSVSVGGTVATNVAITDNPLNLGAQAISAENTAVTATRKAQLVSDLTGRLIVFPFANKENIVNGTTAAMTGTTSTQVLAAVTSNKLYVTSVSCVNSHATVGTFITIQDGSGGTALATLAAGAVYGGDEKTGGGFPLFATTAGNGLYAADVTTGANVICNASGFKGT